MHNPCSKLKRNLNPDATVAGLGFRIACPINHGPASSLAVNLQFQCSKDDPAACDNFRFMSTLCPSFFAGPSQKNFIKNFIK